jgi:hypothetical protein
MPVTASSNIVLSENNGSNNKIIYAACRRKKRKLVPLPASQSSKVQVIEQVKLDLEVENQDLPNTSHFGNYRNAQMLDDDNDSNGSKTVNLLAEDSV